MPDRPAPHSDASLEGPPQKRVALRFISGKYQGGEFPLSEGREVLVGRSSDLDMVLVEEMVSRRHARIELEGGVLTIEDLGSTNGTFVNGEKVLRAELNEGDRVLIGTSILKVVVGSERDGASMGQRPEVHAGKRVTVRQQTEDGPRMRGSIEEIPLPDLLQLFGTSRKNGVLVIRTESGIGRIFLTEGQIQHAAMEGHDQLPALKVIYRMLTWKRGVFELDPPHDKPFENPLRVTVQEVLMEGFRHLDEFNSLLTRLPPMDARLTLRSPLEAPLHELEPAQLDILQLALNSPNLQALLDRSQVTDLDAALITMSLLERGYLQAG